MWLHHFTQVEEATSKLKFSTLTVSWQGFWNLQVTMIETVVWRCPVKSVLKKLVKFTGKH